MSGEAKTTKAYKISQELKEKLERLANESGLETQEAFIEQLAALYELQRLKEGTGSGYAKQIEEYEYHSRRGAQLIVNIVQTEAAERLQLAQQHDDKIDFLSSEMAVQQQEIVDLKKEAKVKAEEVSRLVKENDAQDKLIDQLKTAADDKGALVEEYRQRIDTLSGLVNDYKDAAEENKGLKTEVSRLTELNKDYARQLEQQDERHRDALERQTERKDMEKERELLALRTEYQAKLEKVNEETTVKLRDLYDQRDKLREEIATLKSNGTK